MYEEIMQRYGVNLKNIPTVGDSLRDLQAAAAVGANPILVLTGKGQRTRTNKEWWLILWSSTHDTGYFPLNIVYVVANPDHAAVCLDNAGMFSLIAA